MIGSVVAAGTRAIIWGEADNEVIIHCAPTDWISPPKLEARLAHQIARKIGIDKGEGAWEGSDSDTPSMKRNKANGSNPRIGK